MYTVPLHKIQDAEIIKMFERKMKFSLVRKRTQTKWITRDYLCDKLNEANRTVLIRSYPYLL